VGAGFIGFHVVRHCLAAGYQMIVIDDLSGGFEDHLPMVILLIKGSMTDEKFISSLFTEHKFDYIYHLAAYAIEGFSYFIRWNNINLIGSVNLVNEAVKLKR